MEKEPVGGLSPIAVGRQGLASYGTGKAPVTGFAIDAPPWTWIKGLRMSFPFPPIRRGAYRKLLLVAAAALSPVAAHALSEAQPLRTGEFAWADGPQPAAATDTARGLSITISIAQQRLYLYRDGQLVAMSTASTGKRGHSTPLGDFTILQKRQWHRSNIYSNAPMPYMQRLTWTGIALHAGHLPGYPASHGCIRLPLAFAKQLFAITTVGVPVTVVGATKNVPIVKLRFADIEWIADDEVVTARPAPFIAPVGAVAVPLAAPPIVDDLLPPPARQPSTTPHWASPDAIEAVRKGEAPKLDFEMVPE